MTTPEAIPWGITLDAVGPKDKVRVSISTGEILLQVRTGMGSYTVGLTPLQSSKVRAALEQGEGKLG